LLVSSFLGAGREFFHWVTQKEKKKEKKLIKKI
jgi:hypothetical protein